MTFFLANVSGTLPFWHSIWYLRRFFVGRGPAGITLIQRLLSGSGGYNCDLELVVEVRRRKDAGRGGGGRPADMKSWWLVKQGQTCCFWSCRGRARCPMTLAWNWIDLLSVGLSLSSKLGALPYFSKKTNTLIFNYRILQIVTVDLRYQLLTYRIKSFTAAAPT